MSGAQDGDPAGLAAAWFEHAGEDLVVFRLPVLDVGSAARLSPSERAVIEDVLSGCTNAEIARARGRSPRTVANQIASAYRKLRVGSRSELAAWAVQAARSGQVDAAAFFKAATLRGSG